MELKTASSQNTNLFCSITLNPGPRENFFLAFENGKFLFLRILVIPGFFNVAFSPLVFREASYRRPSVRDQERPGVEVGFPCLQL